MGKRICKNLSFLVSMLLMLQLVLPLSSVLAESSGITSLPPSNLASQLLSPDDVKLSWSAVFGATGYNVYEITEGQLRLHGKTASNSYSVNDLPEGTYSYVVTTLSAEGESGPNAPVTVDIIYPEMAAPATLSYAIKNGNDMVWSWTSSAYATAYNLYQITADGQAALLTSTTGRTYTIANAAEDEYTYAVSAVNALYGESQISSPVTAAVVYPVMAAPGGFTYTLINGSDVALKWNAASYANSYKIYEIVDGQKVLKSTVTGTTITYAEMPAGDYAYEIKAYSERFGESAEGTPLSVTVSAVTMAAPTNFAYKLQNVNDIVLSWSAAANASSYKVYQIIDGEKVLKSSTTARTVTYANMAAGDYVFEVYSFNDRFGESAEGSQVSLTIDAITMAAPSDLKFAVNNGNDIVLTWTPATNANSYKVYQIVNGQKVLKSNVSGTTVTFGNMAAGNYVYEVHSYSTRFGESAEGAGLSFQLVHPVMEPPSNLIQSIENATDFSLSWDASAYATSYKVYLIVDGAKVLKSTVSGTAVTYTGMKPGEYTYVVHAQSSRFGESAEGSELTVTLNGQAMEAPANLAYTIVNGNDIKLTWAAAAYATSYKVYQIVDGEKKLKSTVTANSVTYTNMPAGEYKFVVHSVSALLGESAAGAEAGFTLVHPVMAAPANFAYKIQNGNDVVLTWSLTAYATGYKVYEIIDGVEVLKASTTGLSAKIANVSAGGHAYVVRSTSSRFGDSAEGSRIDLNVAEHTMEAPKGLTLTTVNGNDIFLKWNAVTYATSYNIYRIVDGEKVLAKTSTSTNVTFANMPEGDYSYEVHSYSTRFGESPEASIASHTLVFPIMAAPINLKQIISSGNDIILTWNAAAYATSYNVYRIANGEKVLAKTSTSTSVTFANMPEGDYSYEVHSYSTRFGESPEASKVSFSLAWPVVQPPVLSGTVFNANNITFTWKAVTWANEYRLYEVTGDSRTLIYKGTALTYKVYNLTEESHSYELTAFSNRFGESAPSNELTENIVYPVMQPPTASLKLLSNSSAQISWNFITYANGYNVYEIVNGKPVLLVKNLNNLSYTVSNLSYANHEYYVTSYSNSFGESGSSNIVLAKLIVDTEAPVTTATVPAGWTNESTVISLTATDNETGVAKTYFAIDGGIFQEGTSIAVSEEGIHKLSFYSVDKVGNIEAVKTAEAKIDRTAPTTVSDAPAAWSKEDVTVHLAATDTQSGVSATYYSIDGSAFAEGTAFAVRGEGVHTIAYYSTDAAGNAEAVKTAEVKIDRTAPTTVSDAPAAWSQEDVTVHLAATDTQSGVSATYYSIDGSAFAEGTAFAVRGEGVHAIAYYSTDAAGNAEAIKTVEVKIDKTPPVIALNLSGEYKLGDTVKLNYTAQDNLSGIVFEQMSVAAQGSAGTTVENGGNFKLDKPGDYNVNVTVKDAAGNITVINKQLTVYIPATIEVTPKVIKGNKGVFTVRVGLPSGYGTNGFDLNTATLNGVKALNGNNGYYNQAKNGQFKFERSDFSWTTSEVVVVFRGYVNGMLVIGQTTVKVNQ